MRLYLIAFLALFVVTIDAHAQDLQRGKILHDTYCIACHDARIYTRKERVAGDLAEVRAQVVRWSGNISLGWNAEDIDAVTVFLASRYYGIDCSKDC
ncbi:MAG TPA: cytochrome C [Burkholderiales bacterium]|jgi:mono/diheme cytochrome c family protein|nr:cytochrome C [Burkholderiales bacterium]